MAEYTHEELESMRKQLSDLNAIQQQLVETKARLAAEKRSCKTALLKLKHVEKVASQKIVESMPGINFEDDCNHLTMLLATVMQMMTLIITLIQTKCNLKVIVISLRKFRRVVQIYLTRNRSSLLSKTRSLTR